MWTEERRRAAKLEEEHTAKAARTSKTSAVSEAQGSRASSSDDDEGIPCGRCEAKIPDPVLMCCQCLAVDCLGCRRYLLCNTCPQWFCEACLDGHSRACHPVPKRITGKRTLEPRQRDEQPAAKLHKAEWFDLTLLDSGDDVEGPSTAKPDTKAHTRLRSKQPCDAYKLQQNTSVNLSTESARGTLNARPPDGEEGTLLSSSASPLAR